MERATTIAPGDGLRARPTSKFVEITNEFDADVQLDHADEDDLVPTASMLAVAGLDTGHSESVRLVAESGDAEVALGTLEDILSTPEVKQ